MNVVIHFERHTFGGQMNVALNERLEGLAYNQRIVDRLFSDRALYPINSLSAAVLDYGDVQNEPIIVALLAKVEDIIVEDFLSREDVSMDINAFTRKSSSGSEKDLVLRLDFLFRTSSPRLEAVISGDVRQSELCSALTQVDRLYLFVVNLKGDLQKVLVIDWDVKPHKVIRTLADLRP